MSDKKNIIVCASRFPYPLEKGDKLRLYYQLQSLSQHANVILICTTDIPVEPSHLAKIKQFCAEVHVFKLTKWGLLLQLLFALFKGQPFQVAYFYRQKYHRKIQQLLKETQPAWIFCQLVRMSEYVKHYHACPKTIDYMDALSKGMERRINETAWWKSWFYRMESKRLRQYERKVFDYFEEQIMISEQDRAYIQHPDQQQIKVVPNGVHERFFEDLAIEKKYDFVFTGNFSYAPNILAAQTLVNEILPKINENGFYPTLLLAGASPSPAVRALGSNSVTVSGWVDDIRESYQSAHVFIAPLFIGTGLQNKVLEAMASGLPCITTPLVNNALKGSENKNVLLARNIDDFVEICIAFLKDSNRFEGLGKSGKEFVALHYSWEKINHQLLGFLSE